MPSYKSPSKKKVVKPQKTKKTITKKQKKSIPKKSVNASKKAGYRFHKRMGRYDFYAPSKTSGKKYDAYDSKTGRKLASFGNISYQQYKDKIGYYKGKNHGSTSRRDNYRSRHQKDRLTNKYKQKESAGYFSMNYLW